MKRIILAVLLVIAAAAGRGRTAPAETTPLSLSEFFKTGVVFQDRNGDGVVDFVDARIVVTALPSPGELAAAADVAARLGYETTAMNVPVVYDAARRFEAADAPTIFIGERSLARGEVAAAAIGGTGLKPGEGVVSSFTLAGKPAVAVLGGDDDGLTTAAVMLAGHLPHVWDQKSPTVDKIAEDAREFLGGKGVKPASSAAST